MRQWDKVDLNHTGRSSSLRKAMRKRRIDNGSRPEDMTEGIERREQERLEAAGSDREVEFNPTKGFRYYRQGRPLQ